MLKETWDKVPPKIMLSIIMQHFKIYQLHIKRKILDKILKKQKWNKSDTIDYRS